MVDFSNPFIFISYLFFRIQLLVTYCVHYREEYDIARLIDKFFLRVRFLVSETEYPI